MLFCSLLLFGLSEPSALLGSEVKEAKVPDLDKMYTVTETQVHRHRHRESMTKMHMHRVNDTEGQAN